MSLIPFTCPHCALLFVVAESELNCRIVRHFAFADGRPLDPHAPQHVCEQVVRAGLGYGCAKPLRLVREGTEWRAVPCEYI